MGLMVSSVSAQDEVVWERAEKDPFDTSAVPVPFNDPFAEKGTPHKNSNPFIKDPFSPAGKGGKTANIITFIEHIIVPENKIDTWELNHTNEVITRKLATQWVKAGDAHVAHSSLQVSRDGYSAQGESVLELIYPTELVEMGEGAWPRPIAFETRNLGYSNDLDLHLTDDSWIQARVCFEMAVFKGSKSHDAFVEQSRSPEDVFLPEIDTDRFRTSYVSQLNESHLVGRLDCEAKGDRTRLVFIKFDVSNPPQPKEPILSENASIQINYKIVKVDHKTWSEHFSDKKLTEIQRLSWEWAQKALIQKKASFVFQGECLVAPRQKVTIEEIKEVIYPTHYEPRKNEGKLIPAKTIETSLIPGGFETRNTGQTLEFQAVRLATGQVFVSCAREFVYQAGSTVHHRVKDGEKWVPDATMPRFSSTRLVSHLALVPGEYSLISVIGPNTKDGVPDEAHRLLAFIKVQ